MIVERKFGHACPDKKTLARRHCVLSVLCFGYTKPESQFKKATAVACLALHISLDQNSFMQELARTLEREFRTKNKKTEVHQPTGNDKLMSDN
ncbi:hypothetical protein BaRGS_00013331 [Batillaria attramentaria]|uniref:Uncharacterized protein n=1 Tax=Batillaria attramentaria TaxID=370345 RepID=A0ABD0L7D4_9CAEN